MRVVHATLLYNSGQRCSQAKLLYQPLFSVASPHSSGGASVASLRHMMWLWGTISGWHTESHGDTTTGYILVVGGRYGWLGIVGRICRILAGRAEWLCFLGLSGWGRVDRPEYKEHSWHFAGDQQSFVRRRVNRKVNNTLQVNQWKVLQKKEFFWLKICVPLFLEPLVFLAISSVLCVACVGLPV